MVWVLSVGTEDLQSRDNIGVVQLLQVALVWGIWYL
jgi:hypothetical protein